MRALRLWTDIVEWRWTPAVGLSIAAVGYVGFALLVIPDRIGDSSTTTQMSTMESLRARARGSAFAASIAPNVTEPEAAMQAGGSPAPMSNADLPHRPSEGPVGILNHFPRRGFTPPLERVEAPQPPPALAPPPTIVVPMPPPAAPEPPPPAPPVAAEAPAAPPPAPPVAPPPVPEAAAPAPTPIP